MGTTKGYKRPESVLVVVHSPDAVLLLRRADIPEFWQSVTGSLEWDETTRAAAVRELREETGIAAAPEQLRDLEQVQRFAILPRWRARYAPDVLENTEHAFALALPGATAIRLSSEHAEYRWLDFADAATRVTSWTNRAAILALQNRR